MKNGAERKKKTKERTRIIKKDGERRANDLAERTKREQERGKTEDHPERRTNKESLKPPIQTKRRMSHYGGNEDGNGKAGHQNRTERKKPPNNQRTKP